MKSFMILGCAAAAAFIMTADTASAQCGYGGGGGGGYYGGRGVSVGYSSYAPRTSFNIGYSSFAPRTSYVSRSAYRSVGRYGYSRGPTYRGSVYRGSVYRGGFRR